MEAVSIRVDLRVPSYTILPKSSMLRYIQGSLQEVKKEGMQSVQHLEHDPRPEPARFERCTHRSQNGAPSQILYKNSQALPRQEAVNRYLG